MNNYSWLQKKLHQLALSSQFIRETTFDVESSLFSNEQQTDNDVFVAGLARSGTTILLNALYVSSEFASLSYNDMPFVLAPNLWSKLSFNKEDAVLIERAHGDGIKVSHKSPEAFEEVFWMTFKDLEEDTIRKFKKYIQLIKHRYDKNRYLSKNNQNIRRLEIISNNFPNSKVLIPFRDPIQHANSLLSQHKKFIKDSKEDKFIANYMKLIGHTEFGPEYKPIYKRNLNFKNDLDINHWLEQWCLVYQNCFKTHQDKNNVNFICYEKLCSSKEYWFNILRMLDVKNIYDFEFKESYREISSNIDSELANKAKSLYLKMA
jgi:hypothetical protein